MQLAPKQELKIAVVGGGGVRTPLLLGQMSQREALREAATVYLLDVDARRQGLMEDLSRALAPDLDFAATSDPTEALRGSDFVLLALRVGGESAREIDERIPLRHSCLGQETTGAGGLAMTLRTGPAVLDYLDLCRRVCPEAWILNLTNPSGIMTQLGLDHGWNRLVGMCDAPYALAEDLAGRVGLPKEEIVWEYFGLNHLGWMTGMSHGQRDLLVGVLKELGREGWGKRGVTLFPPDLMRLMSGVPNEYCYFYYFTRQAVSNMQLRPTRGHQLGKLVAGLLSDLERGEEPVRAYREYLARRRGTYLREETGTMDRYDHREALQNALHGGYAGVTLDTIEALAGMGEKDLILNVPNDGRVVFLEDSDVVELPVRVGQDQITPLSHGAVSADMRALVTAVKEYERLAVLAVQERSLEVALRSLLLHPLIPGFSEARAILSGYLGEQASWFEGWEVPAWLQLE